MTMSRCYVNQETMLTQKIYDVQLSLSLSLPESGNDFIEGSCCYNL